MRITKKGILLAILFLTIGLAAVTTTLTINGTITIKPNSDDFENNVKFTTASSTNGTSTVSSDGKSITFKVNEFKTIGDTSTTTFKIGKNSNYVAVLGNVPIVCSSTGENSSFFL